MKIEDSESFESAIARHLLCGRLFPLPEGPLDENSSPTGRAGFAWRRCCGTNTHSQPERFRVAGELPLGPGGRKAGQDGAAHAS